MEDIRPVPRRSGKAIASLIFGLLVLVGLLSILAVVFGDVVLSSLSVWRLLGFAPLVSILAVPLGHLALSNIRKSAGRLGGGQFAVAGLVFGYLGLVWTFLIAGIFWIHPLYEADRYGYGAAGLRTLSSATDLYSATYSNGYPPSLESLGPSEDDLERYVDWLKGVHRDNTPSCDHADLIDEYLASGLKAGFKFTYVAQMSDQAKWTPSAEAKKRGCTVAGVSAFTATAEPISSSKGLPSYFVDQSGIIRESKKGPATANSPPIERQ